MTVSQPPWPANAATTDAVRPSDPGSDPIRLLLIDRDEMASVRLAAELRPLQHQVSAVVSTDAAIEWLEQQ